MLNCVVRAAACIPAASHNNAKVEQNHVALKLNNQSGALKTGLYAAQLCNKGVALFYLLLSRAEARLEEVDLTCSTSVCVLLYQ